MEETITMLKIDSVSKEYKLGQIGGTTLRDELQRLNAKIRHKEDPTKRIGAKDYNKGEIFKALDGISFEVKKGERVGIIGHNGAGKSTLLKLISRVTAPTSGEIGLNGRVASMLEVGTGFHGELTGRENIYMNGAILGMTKKEIDAKIEDIIEFSECRQFIDTPVKRYSSGMYVKLAFSVAAHLDSEIMIMDEVLAVGDMAFQKKCIEKMNDVSRAQGRTILYVSHNMNTIRQLCDRVIVLDHGKMIFDGENDDGIRVYLDTYNSFDCIDYDLLHSDRPFEEYGKKILITGLQLCNKKNAVYNRSEKMVFKLSFTAKESFNSLRVYFILMSLSGNTVGTTQTAGTVIDAKKSNDYELKMSFDISNLANGRYFFQPDIFWLDENNNHHSLDHPIQNICFEISDNNSVGMNWRSYFGSVILNPLVVINE